MVPALNVPLKPEPFGCDGGCSRVVPCTVAVHGGTSGAPVAAHVAASLMPRTTTEIDVLGRRSANPLGAGNVVISTIRKRSRVMFAPVLLTNLRRRLSVPKV